MIYKWAKYNLNRNLEIKYGQQKTKKKTVNQITYLADTHLQIIRLHLQKKETFVSFKSRVSSN